MDMGNVRVEFVDAYETNADALFRFAYFSVRDREVAKDLVADTFSGVWEYMAKGNRVENIRALCYRILRNRIIDHWRKHGTLSLDRLTEEGYEPPDPTEEDPATREEYRTVRKAVSDLPATYREVIVLRYIEGYSPKEIVELLGVSPSLVSVRIFRAQRLLRKRLSL